MLPGLEVLLRDSLHLVRGRRVGLITNHTAVTRAGRSAIDLLHEHPDVRLVALLGPEHGIRGMHPRNLGMGPMLQMLGSRWATEAVRRGDDPRDIFRRREAENAAWKERVQKYRLYPAQ